MQIKTLHLLSDNLEATHRFYSELLQFPLRSMDEELLSVKAGHSVLNFHKSEQQQPVYHFAFNIPHNQFDAALQWVSSKLELVNIMASDPVADFKNWNAKAFYFYDNNRNIVEMIARFDLPNTASIPFSGEAVCSISEIGTVVEDPESFAAELLGQYQLVYFSKQAPSHDFKAIGDDEGLFIIVPPKRNWYPTQLASTMNWTKVEMTSGGDSHEIVLHESRS